MKTVPFARQCAQIVFSLLFPVYELCQIRFGFCRLLCRELLLLFPHAKVVTSIGLNRWALFVQD